MVSGFQRFTVEDDQDVRTFMDRLSMLPPAEAPQMVDIRLLWLKGQLLKRWESERRVHAPLDVIERLQLAGGLAIAGLLIAWSLLFRLIALVTV